MKSIAFNIVVSGDSAFIRSFGVPLAEWLEKNAKALNMQLTELPNQELFYLDTHPKNIELSTVGIFGVLLFIPTWFAKKVLDEVYDLKIKPIVKGILKKADGVEIFSSKKKYKTFVFSMFYEEHNALIVVAIKEKSLDALASSLEIIPSVHVSALATLQEGNHKEPIHLYIVGKGKVNIRPYEHKVLASAFEQINT